MDATTALPRGSTPTLSDDDWVLEMFIFIMYVWFGMLFLLLGMWALKLVAFMIKNVCEYFSSASSASSASSGL